MVSPGVNQRSEQQTAEAATSQHRREEQEWPVRAAGQQALQAKVDSSSSGMAGRKGALQLSRVERGKGVLFLKETLPCQKLHSQYDVVMYRGRIL